MKLYVIIHSDSKLPLAIYDTFEAAKTHIDILTKQQEYAIIYEYTLNEKAQRSARPVFDNM